MSHSDKYVPILKGRMGEFGALAAMPIDRKRALTPFFEVPPVPWDHKNQRPAKSIDEHLQKLDENIERSWGKGGSFFVEMNLIGEDDRMATGEHPVSSVFRQLRGRKLSAIPVTGFARNPEYDLACRRVLIRDGRGVCIRLQPEDFSTAEIASHLKKLMSSLSVRAESVDLLMDFGPLDRTDSSRAVAHAISLVDAVPEQGSWRSFIIAGTSFPANLGGCARSSVTEVPRLEWEVWRRVAARKGRPRRPTFGDYAICHPEHSEVDPRIMKPSASIRYTTDRSWFVFKGKNLKDHGFQQFHAVARSVKVHPVFSGERFSWGDDYIARCAQRQAGCGNLTTWRKVGTSHHIAFVSQQLEAFGGS
jgi:Beta protein